MIDPYCQHLLRVVSTRLPDHPNGKTCSVKECNKATTAAGGVEYVFAVLETSTERLTHVQIQLLMAWCLRDEGKVCKIMVYSHASRQWIYRFALRPKDSSVIQGG